MIFKQLHLVTLGFVFALNFVHAQNAVQEAIDAFVSNAYFKNASVSFQAVDCETGEIIATRNPYVALSPASTTKLFSTATAFQLLGKDYAPETKIYSDAPLGKNGVIQGNIWIRGAGDVTLGSRYYNGDGLEASFIEKWADTLLKMGVKVVQGAVYADGSAFGYEALPDGWAWGDIGNYYGAGASGLPIYDNMLRYYFRTTKNVGAKTELVRTFPVMPNLVFHNYITCGGSGDNSYIYGAPYGYDRFGTGTLGAVNGSYTVKGSLPDPELTFAQEVLRIFKEKGIQITDSCRTARQEPYTNATAHYASKHLLLIHKGKTLNSVAWWTNMKSVNLFAEEILCWVGYGTSGNGSTENSLKRLNSYWSGKINTIGLNITDGSGLSRSNGISASHFTEMLRYMTKSKEFKAFYETLPVAGESGTLKSVCSGQSASGKVHAKSGTMNRIKSYAGYVESKSGKRIAFALIINNFNCSSDYTVSQMEKVFNAMALF